MTVTGEIEQLKNQIAQTKDEEEEAELLLELLQKYADIRNYESESYIHRLIQLGEKLGVIRYKAWGLQRLADAKYVVGEYDISLNLIEQSLALFEQINDGIGLGITNSGKGILQLYKGDYSGALKSYLKALEIRQAVGDKSGLGITYSNIGIIHNSQGNYSEALKNYLQALQINEEIGYKSGMPNTYNAIGSILANQGKYPEALKNYLQAIQIAEEIGHKSAIANSNSNIGDIHKIQGRYSDALNFFFRALKIREETGDQSGIASEHVYIGSVHVLQGYYTEALENYLLALRIYEKIGQKISVGSTRMAIGEVYEKQGNYPEALKYYSGSFQINQEVGNQAGIADYYLGIGSVYAKQGNFEGAIKAQLTGAELGEKVGHKNLIKQSYHLLSNTYKTSGDFENALKYHEKFHQVESEMLGEQSRKQLTDLNFMHNMEQKEKEAEINRLRNVELKGALDHLQIEKDRSESLLLNILPSEVAEELKAKGESEAKLFEDVTVLFTDFKGFTTVSEQLSPRELVSELDACFKAFDGIIGKYNIEKIKTVGDAYMAVAGLPVPNANHAEDVAKAALQIRDFMLERKLKTQNSKLETFEVRIGVHSGSVVAGIVGVKKFAYDIWGDTVNTAARMEQNGEAGKVNISEATYELVKDKFTCLYRGEIEAKNKGKLKMYFVERTMV